MPCQMKHNSMMLYYMQELDDEVLVAAELNNVAVVSKWLKDLPKEDVNTRDKLVQILKRAAQSVSVDVIALFEPSSKYYFNSSLIFIHFYT